MKAFIIICSCFFSFLPKGKCQLPYTIPQYSITKDSAVLVGTVTNYCNFNYDIKVNIYKPLGDFNNDRPVAIFVHGGGFVSPDNFNEGNMNAFAQDFAKRGYVGVSIDYREGMHLIPYSQGYPYPVGLGILLDWDGAPYAADSAEVYRAGYRAQQDLKAVIRFMKKRNLQDSSNTCKYFLGGHSAGAITILTATFLDQESEKPAQGGPLANASNPNWLNNFLQINGPENKDDLAYLRQNPPPLNYDLASCYTRPDLGPVAGTLHTDAGYDTRVLGIAPLAGALVDTTLLNVQTFKPAIFFYHIAVDQVVPYTSGKPFPFLCDLLYPCPNSNWPKVYGSNFLYNKLNQIGYPAAKQLWTFDNGGNPLNSHDILPYPSTVADSMAKFFAKVLDTCTTCPPTIVLATSTEFYASKKDNGVELTWKANNPSLQSFIVEHSSDGISFQPIATVNYLSSTRSYTWMDFNFVKNGNNFYRLKEIYITATAQYSTVKQVNFNAILKTEIFPNPIHKEFTIVFQSGTIFSTATKIELVNASGQVVFSKLFSIRGFSQNISLPAVISKGIYFVRIINNEAQIKETHRVLVN